MSSPPDHTITLKGKGTLGKRKIEFLLIYADWCGYCHTFMPSYLNAAHQLKNANFYRLEGTGKNELIESLTEGNWEGGFPFIAAYKNGKFIEDYRGERDLSSYMKYCMDFIQKHI